MTAQLDIRIIALVGRGFLFEAAPLITDLPNRLHVFFVEERLHVDWSAPIHINGRTITSAIIDYPDVASGLLSVRLDGTVVFENYLTIGEVRGSIDSISGGWIRGWVSKLGSGGKIDRIELTMDDYVIGQITSHVPRPEFRWLTNAGGGEGFKMSIPAAAFDGRQHSFGLIADGKVISLSRSWRFNYLGNIDMVEPGTVVGWCFDPEDRNSSVDLALVSGGTVLAKTTTSQRSDVFDAHSAPLSGFAFSIPKGTSPFHIAPAQAPEVCMFGPYEVRSMANRIAELHAAAAALREEVEAASPGHFRSIADTLSRELSLLRSTFSSHSYVERTLRAPANNCSPSNVVVIIPVYNGYEEVVDCLESALRTTPAGCELVVIDDCSPDPEISEYLRSLAQQGRITLLVNEENLGFPRSVNRGLELRRSRDVVLLNADTVVPSKWLERLIAAAYIRPNVASVTPMSNNATICSYPLMNFENPLPQDVSFEALDGMFADAPPEYVVTPTGVGFCLYMRGYAMDVIGGLSEEWNRGYAEEVDWCTKAKDAGFLNIITTGLFVQHEGSVSFGKDVRNKLSAENNAKLNLKYPEYLHEVMNFINDDPLRRARIFVDIERIKRLGSPIIAHVTHTLGGGTDVHITDLSDALQQEGCIIVRVLPYTPKGDWAQAVSCTSIIEVDELNIKMFLTSAELIQTLSDLKTSVGLALHIHSTLEWDLKLLGLLSREFRPCVTIHDYAWFCPNVQMLQSDTHFCGQPTPAHCSSCVRLFPPSLPTTAKVVREGGIARWIDDHREIVNHASGIVAPSESARQYFNIRFPHLAVSVVPHRERVSSMSVSGISKDRGVLVIGVIGAIGPHKGFEVLRSMARSIEQYRLPLQIRVIGYTCNDKLLLSDSPSISISGKYKRSALHDLVQRNRPDIILIPSIWPETYCYTLSEAWAAGLPVAVFDLGAQAERVRKHGGGLIIPNDTAWEDIGAWILSKVREGAVVDQDVDIRSDVMPRVTVEYYKDQKILPVGRVA